VKYAIYLFIMCTQKMPGILVLLVVQTHASGRHV